MADLREPVLKFVAGGCPDCGERGVTLPPPLPAVGDDFDWRARDYDGLRRSMLEELAARFPERRRWTPGDLEVVLVELLAAALDQLSDMSDRVAAEACLDTARNPRSVRRLLELTGYDAVADAPTPVLKAAGIALAPTGPTEPQRRALERYWLRDPLAMDMARRAGPAGLSRQRRMVTAADHAARLEEHPLVLRAKAWRRWTGSWSTWLVAVILEGNRTLDGLRAFAPALAATIEDFHRRQGLPLPDLAGVPPARALLRPLIEARRLTGAEVRLVDAVQLPIGFTLSVGVGPGYFRSEVRNAIAAALGTGPDGLFAPGRCYFGEDLPAGDIIQAVTALPGVEHACLDRLRRLGAGAADQTVNGRIELDGLEIAICDNQPGRPERGYYRLVLHGGQRG